MSNMMTFNNVYNKIILEQDENEEQTIDKKLELKFSNNLAAEFTQTMNEMTTIAAQIVNERSVDKDLYDKFIDLHSKVKNIIDAARNSK